MRVCALRVDTRPGKKAADAFLMERALFPARPRSGAGNRCGRIPFARVIRESARESREISFRMMSGG
jgi:hypothetical protein